MVSLVDEITAKSTDLASFLILTSMKLSMENNDKDG